MRRSFLATVPAPLLLIALVLLPALLGMAACGSGGPPRREYQLKGQILSIGPNGTEAQIKHDEIKGFMAAMTMTYKVREAQQYAGLAPGDTISATLVVVDNEAYLKDVTKTGTAPLDKPQSSAAPSAASGFELLKLGEPAPNVRFLDEDGRTKELASFKGAPVVLTFIYTRCPLPNFCPLMDRNFVALQKSLKEAAGPKVHLLSVSFDPTTDTPPVLKKHANDLGADPAMWTFATGDRDEIDRFAMRFGVTVVREMNDPRDITHTLRTALLDGTGKLVKTYVGNEWKPEQVLEDLRALPAGN